MNDPHTAYILTNKVTHARLLPQESAHAFNYPTIAFLLPLRALERNELDLARGWVFGYGRTRGRVTGLKPEAYLYEDGGMRSGEATSRRRSIMEKLKQVVSERGYPGDELHDAWMLTMPSYFGFEGINPLTVYFVYKKDGSLWLVVLEIHNTFSERHVHVLCVGEDEDEVIPHGYAHSWTFARQFHVSPFNDRSGYYNCAIIPPSHPPFFNVKTGEDETKFPNTLPTIRIHLYTQATSSQSSQLKLTATLRSTQSIKLTSSNLLSTLTRYPFTLFLSFVRIAYHAWILHYVKRLDVYVRPEPAAGAGVEKDKEGRLPLAANVPCGGAGGGVGWQKEGVLERYARRRTGGYLARRAVETNTKIVLESTNPTLGTRVLKPSSATAGSKTLTITYRSPRVFPLLLASPSLEVFLAVARDAERLLGISDEHLFREIFAANSSDASRSAVLSAMLTLRNAMVPRSCRASRHCWSTSGSKSDAGTDPAFDITHPLDVSPANSTNLRIIITNILIITATHLLSALERLIFTLTSARFVRGDEPWLVWERAGEAMATRMSTSSRQGQCQNGTEVDCKIGGGDDDARWEDECEYGCRDRDGRGIGSVRRPG